MNRFLGSYKIMQVDLIQYVSKFDINNEQKTIFKIQAKISNEKKKERQNVCS